MRYLPSSPKPKADKMRHILTSAKHAKQLKDQQQAITLLSDLSKAPTLANFVLPDQECLHGIQATINMSICAGTCLELLQAVMPAVAHGFTLFMVAERQEQLADHKYSSCKLSSANQIGIAVLATLIAGISTCWGCALLFGQMSPQQQVQLAILVVRTGGHLLVDDVMLNHDTPTALPLHVQQDTE